MKKKKIPMKITGQKHICVFYDRSISSDYQGYILLIFQKLSPSVFFSQNVSIHRTTIFELKHLHRKKKSSFFFEFNAIFVL